MNALRRWIALSAVACVALTGTVISAEALQRPRDYIGTYRRQTPSRGGRGSATIIMDIAPGGRAVIHTIHPRGIAAVRRGRWHVRHGELIVSTDRSIQRYRLSGRNLDRADNPNIFFKKQ